MPSQNRLLFGLEGSMTETTGLSDDETGVNEEATELEEGPETLHGRPVTQSHGQTVLHTQVDGYQQLIQELRDDGYEVCVDLCGADHLGNNTRVLPSTVPFERFEVVVNLLDVQASRRIRIRVQIPETSPTIASISDIHPGAEAMERETTDMFGVQFEGHPDPTPILLPDGWEGHPLRKDFSMGRIPVQFKAVDGR